MFRSATPAVREYSLAGLAGRRTSRWLALPPNFAGIVAALLCFFTAGLALWSFYENALRLLKENLRDALRSGASVLANSIDPETHRLFTERAQENSPEYARAVAGMEALRKALNAGSQYRFVYTCIRRQEGIYFVLDPTPPGDADHDGVEDKSHIGDFYAEANPRLRRVFDTGIPDVDEEPVVDSWGSALSGYAPIRDSAGNVTAVAGVDLELTEFNARIARLRQIALSGCTGAAVLSCLAGLVVKNYHRRLQRSVAELLAAMDQAKAGERAKSEFLATVSHELRTPLNGIVGMVDLLRETPLNARQRKQADTIHRSGELLQLIIDDILDWSRIESGALQISRSPVNLQRCLKEVHDWFLPLAERNELTLEVEQAPGCPEWFEGDPLHLRQLLMHLTGNAVKFTHEGGVLVRVTYEKPEAEKEGRLVFMVKDTGIGILPELQEKIFEPFSQGDATSTRHYGGTGLGLAISRRLCHAMGGEISLRSVPRLGSEFSFHIRCVPMAPPAQAERRSTASGDEGPSSGSANAAALPANQAPTAAPKTSSPPLPLPGEGLPVLLVSPDRMLIHLSGLVLKRLQQPLEHRPDIAAASEFLARSPCRAVLIDSAQIDSWEAPSTTALREAAGHPLRLIVLLAGQDTPPPSGFDAAISRRLRMTELDAALGAPPGPGTAVA